MRESVKKNITKLKKNRWTCSRRYILYGNFVFMLLSILALIFSILLIVGVGELRQFTIEGPNYIYIGLGSVSLATFIMGTFGVWAVVRTDKKVLICYTMFALVMAIIQLVVVIFALLYANDIATIDSLDDLLLSLQDEVELSLVNFAEEDPVEWQKTQDVIDCCGVDFESLYLFNDFNKTLGDFVSSQLSGNGCNTNHGIIIGAINLSPTYSEATEDAVLAAVGSDYFCKDKVGAFTRGATLYIGIVIGIVIFFQLISVICCYILLCSRPKEEDEEAPTNEFYSETMAQQGNNISATLGRKKRGVNAFIAQTQTAQAKADAYPTTTNAAGFTSPPPPPRATPILNDEDSDDDDDDESNDGKREIDF